MRVETVNYTSAGLTCAADLYLPDTPGPVPGVVCGESGVKVKEMIAAPAKYLVEAGFAVLAIDYRSTGGSEGEPRGQLFPEQQVTDFRNAISYLQGRDEVDADRIGIWGNSVAGSVVIQTAVLDRRIGCVVAQSPSMLNGWSATLKIAGSPAFGKLRDSLQADFEQRAGSHDGQAVPWLQFGKAGDEVSQSYVDLADSYPSFRNEILLESHEHFLTWAPEYLIDRLAPTPLLIVTNGGPDPYHELSEVQTSFAKAGQPKHLEILPFDAMGLYSEPGLGAAMKQAVDWFDRYLRRTPLPALSPKAQDISLTAGAQR
ncbi:alpha/beta fold hydrolase [Kribbella sp. NPDC056861]|uniref:alpha/beta hydrolase n=1 Tax=Kribbella sp. NPDC056861 TaxID=3154857 RepID=UPI00343BE191